MHTRIEMLAIAIAVAFALGLGATVARAQAVADHLQCYRVTNATLKSLKGVVDLDAPTTGLAPGCKLRKAKFYCVPAEQKVQPGTLFDGRVPVNGLPYNGPPAETDRICYRVSCVKPNGTAADQTVTDEFGTHAFRKLTTEMVCKPATGGTLPPPGRGFQIKTPEIEIQPRQDIAHCYYFRTSNAVTVPVKRWVSEMRPITQQVVMLTTTTPDGVPLDQSAPGTVSTVDCEVVARSGLVSQWVYAADTPSAEMTLPADDGAGNPVAFEIPPNSAGYLLMHNVNPSDEVAKAQITINAEALDGAVYTRSSTFATYDSSVAIPPMTNGYVKSRSCDVPAGARFWRMTTHAHRRAVHTSILDGANAVFDSTDWAHPGAQTFLTPPFFTFASNRLTYSCEYNNPSSFTVRTGTSYQTEEQCVAVGYFFPATKPVWCHNGFIF